MKNITLFALFLAIGFTPLLVKADVPPANSHPLERCAKVVNLDKFPDINLIAVVTGPMIDSSEVSIIKNNECISKGYKFNNINIYWNTKEKSTVIDESNSLIKSMDVYGGYVNNSSSLKKETVEYLLVESGSGKYSLQKTKLTSEYLGSSLVKVEDFKLGQAIKDVSVDETITKSMRMGLRNDLQVKHLQSVLNKLLSLSLSVDGSFGQKTKNAVIAFQKTKGLVPDGIVGPKTISEINKVSSQ